jgi:hypothetical protein
LTSGGENGSMQLYITANKMASNVHAIKLLILTLAFDNGYLSQKIGLSSVPPCVLQSVQLEGAPVIYSDLIPP